MYTAIFGIDRTTLSFKESGNRLFSQQSYKRKYETAAHS